MQYDWVIDVLADLKKFAQQNELTLLSEQLDDSIMIAAEDIKRSNQALKGGAAHERKTGEADHRVAVCDLP